MQKLLILVVFVFPFFTHAITFAELPLKEQVAILAEDTDARISQLAWCESRWNERVKVWDVNSYSYGWLQFKMNTWLNEGKKYKILPPEFTKEEAQLLIFNRHLQIAIAKEMLKQPGGWRAWFNCSKMIKLDRVPYLVFLWKN